jgi:hypothetical protein
MRVRSRPSALSTHRFFLVSMTPRTFPSRRLLYNVSMSAAPPSPSTTTTRSNSTCMPPRHPSSPPPPRWGIDDGAHLQQLRHASFFEGRGLRRRMLQEGSRPLAAPAPGAHGRAPAAAAAARGHGDGRRRPLWEGPWAPAALVAGYWGREMALTAGDGGRVRASS